MGMWDAFGRFMGHVIQGEGDKALDVLSETSATPPASKGGDVVLVECRACRVHVPAVDGEGKCEACARPTVHNPPSNVDGSR